MIRRIVQRWAAKRAATIKPPSRRAAVMVPLPTTVLSAEEEVSMLQLRAHLDHYDKFLLVPRGMKTSLAGFRVIELDRKHFGSAASHNRMLYLPEFWELFSDYDYALMYHLDALVFSDQLADWCRMGYDFIGAPFLNSPDSPWVREERVGNGGFALYHVPAVLKVLWNRYRMQPSKYFEDHFWKWIEWQRQVLKPVRAAAPRCLKHGRASSLRAIVKRLDHIEANELQNDCFWADEAKRYDPGFNVAPIEDGLRFAFEVVPSVCLERNGGNMPFGCHAWARYDKAFWMNKLGTETQRPADP